MNRLLDLFCGAGGAAMGYKQAGFAEIVGVDNMPQPHYPFEFHHADAFDFLNEYGPDFDFIHASPPCQRYTQMLNHGMTDRRKHPDFVGPTRNALREIGVPFSIENVAGAPLISPVMLCGEMFGLRVIRHRFFECSFEIRQPEHLKHRGHAHRKKGDGGYYYRVYGHETGKKKWGGAMGIHWMRSPELAQAIPPAFTNYIGRNFLNKKGAPNDN